MSLESYIRGDPRLSINVKVATWLDEIRDALKEERMDDDSYHIIMTAVALFKEKRAGDIPDYDCMHSLDSTKGTRQILNYKRLSDDYLAFLYSEAINEFGPDKLDKLYEFKELDSLWSKWAEEGIKILYCNYFRKYYRKHDVMEFLDKICDVGDL